MTYDTDDEGLARELQAALEQQRDVPDHRRQAAYGAFRCVSKDVLPDLVSQVRMAQPVVVPPCIAPVIEPFAGVARLEQGPGYCVTVLVANQTQIAS